MAHPHLHSSLALTWLEPAGVVRFGISWAGYLSLELGKIRGSGGRESFVGLPIHVFLPHASPHVSSAVRLAGNLVGRSNRVRFALQYDAAMLVSTRFGIRSDADRSICIGCFCRSDLTL